jgi:hypothetical protein
MEERRLPVPFQKFIISCFFSSIACSAQAAPLSSLFSQDYLRKEELCKNPYFDDCRNPVGEFKTAYNDTENQIVWSEVLSGVYSNGCRYYASHGSYGHGEFDRDSCSVLREIPLDPDSPRRVDNSIAELACKRIGARLPTRNDVVKLFLSFKDSNGNPLVMNATSQHKEHVQPTRAGLQAIHEKFSDGFDFNFWTSQIVGGDGSYYSAYEFDAKKGETVHKNRVSRSTVRCVYNTVDTTPRRLRP